MFPGVKEGSSIVFEGRSTVWHKLCANHPTTILLGDVQWNHVMPTEMHSKSGCSILNNFLENMSLKF